jgi:hypothetical protein
MILRTNVHDWADVDLERVSTADFLLQLWLTLKGKVADIDVILKREGELAI